MKSQYLEPYKTHVLKCLKQGIKPLSVGTFLAYRIRGNAKNWLSRYLRSLKNGLKKDGWVPCQSRLKGLAYKPKNT